MAELCAPNVAPDTLRRIASVESSFNPYAIGVVGGRLARQPRSKAEALATADMLAANGYDYSVGVVQVNQKNFVRFGITPEQAFDPCTNLRIGSQIFEDCLKRAGGSPSEFGDALSCYYSGNFSTGYSRGYVARVLNTDPAMPAATGLAIPVIPTAQRRQKPMRPMPQMAASEPLFVSTPAASINPVASGDGMPTKTGPDTALLF